MGISQPTTIEEITHYVSNLRVVDGALIGDVTFMNTERGKLAERLWCDDLVDFKISGLVKVREHDDQKVATDLTILAVNATAVRIE